MRSLLLVSLALVPAVVCETACTSTFTGDTKVEQCAKFCKVTSKSSHCPRCQCKLCSFCLPPKPPPPPPPPPVPAPAPAPMACNSGLTGDAKTQKCVPWCSLKSKATHCQRCDCKACAMCGGSATPAGAPKSGASAAPLPGASGAKAAKTAKAAKPPSMPKPPASASTKTKKPAAGSTSSTAAPGAAGEAAAGAAAPKAASKAAPKAAPKPAPTFAATADAVPSAAAPKKPAGTKPAGTGAKPPLFKGLNTTRANVSKALLPGLTGRLPALAAKAGAKTGACESWCAPPTDCALSGCLGCAACPRTALGAALARAANRSAVGARTPQPVPPGGLASAPMLMAPSVARPAAAARPASTPAAWAGVALAAVLVLLLGVALSVICHPPLAARLPGPLRAALDPLAKLGVGRQGYGGIQPSDGAGAPPGGDDELDDEEHVAVSPKLHGGGAPLRTADGDDGQSL